MSVFVPVPKTPGKCRHWRPPHSAMHLQQESFLPIVREEFASAALTYPLGFVEKADGLLPIALLGLAPGMNLYVDDAGRWLGRYMPAVGRAYPFRLGKLADGGDALCIDENALIAEPLSTDLPLYQGDNSPQPRVLEALSFLKRLSESHLSTRVCLQALQDLDLIVPWRLSVKAPDGEAQEIQGLLCMDEARLNQLPDQDFVGLRTSGALALAYCQLLSMNNLGLLSELASRAHERAKGAQTVKSTLAKGETIDFSGFAR